MPVSSEAIFEIKQTLLDAIDNDTLNLPTLPEVAVEIRKVASSPDAAVKDLCKVLETDPTVAASVIKVANSPLFRGNGKIDNLRAAATRLGTRYTANFATGVAMRQLFNAKSPFINQLMVSKRILVIHQMFVELTLYHRFLLMVTVLVVMMI